MGTSSYSIASFSLPMVCRQEFHHIPVTYGGLEPLTNYFKHKLTSDLPTSCVLVFILHDSTEICKFNVMLWELVTYTLFGWDIYIYIHVYIYIYMCYYYHCVTVGKLWEAISEANNCLIHWETREL